VAAVIENEGRFLLALRQHGKSLAGHWEFPGGKVEANEKPRHALSRELLEELAATDVQVHESLGARPHDYESVRVLIDA
jgi:mutator protein MutT